jgi:hypothetical protein
MKKALIIVMLMALMFASSCIIIDDDDDWDRARIYVHNKNVYELTLDIYMDGDRMFTLSYNETGQIRDVPYGDHRLEAFWWNPYYNEWELEASTTIHVRDRGDYHWYIE